MNDRERTLSTVERVRANAVERARGELARHTEELERAEALLHECQAAHATAAAACTKALRTQAALDSPKELLWAERHALALRLDAESARLRVLRAQAHQEQQALRVSQSRDALRELELDRRVVASAIERGRNDAALVRSRRQEDENDEAFRTRKG